MSQYSHGGSSDYSRQLVLRDSSKGSKGSKGEYGSGLALAASVVASVDDNGLPDEERSGILEPRNWHEAVLKDPITPAAPQVKNRRFGVALISDYQNGFPDFHLNGKPASSGAGVGGSSSSSPAAAGAGPAGAAGAAISAYLQAFIAPRPLVGGGSNTWLDPQQPAPLPPDPPFPGRGPGAGAGLPGQGGGGAGQQTPVGTEDPASPYMDDWSGDQRSTRITDYNDNKGRTALFAQLARVVDDITGEYSVAIPYTRTITSHHDSAAAGMLWDDASDRTALMDTLFASTNPSDVVGTGREGTQCCILGLRHDAHVEWDGNHGRIHYRKTDISAYQEGAPGIPCKGFMGWDPSVANTSSQNGHEAGQWRPIFVMPLMITETPGVTTTDGPSSISDLVDTTKPAPTYNSGVFLELPLGGNTGTGTPPLTTPIALPKRVGYLSTYRGTSGVNFLAVAQQRAAEAVTWGMALPPQTSIGDIAPVSTVTLTIATGAFGSITAPNTGSGTEQFGNTAVANGTGSTALGGYTTAADSSVAAGFGATSGANGVALGNNSTAATNGMAFGASAKSTLGNTAIFGSTVAPINEIGWGVGETSTVAPVTARWKGTDAATTVADLAGSSLDVRTGRSTGAASGGDFTVSISPKGLTGTTLRSAVTRFRVSDLSTLLYNADLSTLAEFGADNKLAFFGVARVARQATTATTDSSGGTPSTTFAAAPAAYGQVEQNNFRASVASQLNALRSLLVAYGLSS